MISPHISPISCCGRRKAHCGAPYSRRPAKRSVNYAGADLSPNVPKAHWVVRRATASFRRPRDVNR
jgi:hypothetical protein